MDNVPVSAALESSSDNEILQSVRRLALDVVETLLLALIIYLGINAVTARIRVDGYSMEPTLHHNEFVLVNRLALKMNTLHRGDIIVFRFPGNPSEDYIKRIIGLPGDRVEIKNSQVFVNDQFLQESYIAAEPVYSGEWEVSQGHFFVLGDNRNNSSDSHTWGQVPFEDVVGKAYFVYWPPKFWGALPDSASAAPQK